MIDVYQRLYNSDGNNVRFSNLDKFITTIVQHGGRYLVVQLDDEAQTSEWDIHNGRPIHGHPDWTSNWDVHLRRLEVGHPTWTSHDIIISKNYNL